MGKREDHKTRTREALATAAVELFLEETYDTVTMGDVADAVGVSRRTAYRYFAAKDEMVMSIPVASGKSVAAGQAAFRYSLMSPSHRLVRRTVTVAGGASGGVDAGCGGRCSR